MRQFGLTEKEEEMYIAILEERSATATEIAKRTDVSKRHVYNIAQKLKERELALLLTT